MMGAVNWKDVLARTVKTFVQAFIGVVPVTAISAAISEGDLSQIAALGLAGAAAGIAAVVAFIWNALLGWSQTE
jgi:hypothetical protein